MKTQSNLKMLYACVPMHGLLHNPMASCQLHTNKLIQHITVKQISPNNKHTKHSSFTHKMGVASFIVTVQNFKEHKDGEASLH